MPKVVVQGRIAVPHAPMLESKLGPNWTVQTWDPATDSEGNFATIVKDALVIIGGAIPLATWPAVPSLKLFQIPWTGHEFCQPETMPAGIPVANCFEHETAIAEYVMLGMLEWQIGLRTMDRRFREKGWDGHGPGMARFHGEVRGRTIGIVGFGHIGVEVARRAKAFGMKVCGVRRKSMPVPPELDWLGQLDDLDHLLAESDFVLVACDLNSVTMGIIDAAKLAKMRRSAVIINIARGGIIVEGDLYAALQYGQIGGAILDVWYNYKNPGEAEPWPCNYPFQSLDNVILSGHESGWTREQVERRWQFVAENVQRVAQGQEPHNVVFTGKQVQGRFDATQ